jgi:hypothetical protein
MSKIFTGTNIAIASAVAMALASGVGSAAKLSATAVNLSAEAIGSTTNDATRLIAVPAINILTEQSYDNEQLIVLTFNNLTIHSVDNAADVTCLTAGGGAGSIDFAVQSFTSNTVTLRANGRSGANAGNTCTIPLNTIRALPGQFATPTTATFTSTGTNVGNSITFDAGTSATAVLVSANQFTAAATLALDGVIDSQNGAGQFAAGGQTDVLAFRFNNTATLNGYNGAVATNASVNEYRATITGDFSFVDDDGDGCTASDFGAGNGQIAVAGVSAASALAGGTDTTVTSVATACTSFTVALNPPANQPVGDAVYGLTVTFTKSATAAPQLIAGNWTVATSVNYGQDTTATASYSTFSGGAWTYNGFVAVVPFMPIQTGYTNTIYLSNRSGQSGGSISVTAYVEGAAPCTFTLTGANITGNRTLSIGGLIRNQIRTACPTFGAGNLRATLRITAPLPSRTTELVSQYTDTATGRTVPVVNSSTVYRDRD